MPYALLGLFGRDLTAVQQEIPGSTLIELSQGIWLLPLTGPLLASIAEPAFTSHFPDVFPRFFSVSLADKLSQMTNQTLAYLEIDCEGGYCQRTAVFFRTGHVIWTSTEDDWAAHTFREAGLEGAWVTCTNLALQLLGVQAEDGIDELATLGLTGPPFRTAWQNFDTFNIDQ